MTRNPAPYIGKEDDFQKSVAKYLDSHRVAWCHVPNGEGMIGDWKDKKRIAKLKKMRAMGLKKGIPDILIFEPSGQFNGLAIELKVKPNKPTPDQLEWLERLKACNWQTAICYGLDEFVKVFEGYFKTKI